MCFSRSSCHFLPCPVSSSCFYFCLFSPPFNFACPKGEILVSTTERDGAGTAPGEARPCREQRSQKPQKNPQKRRPLLPRTEDAGGIKGTGFPEGAARVEIGFVPPLCPLQGFWGDPSPCPGSGTGNAACWGSGFPGFPKLWEAGGQNLSGSAHNGCGGVKFPGILWGTHGGKGWGFIPPPKLPFFFIFWGGIWGLALPCQHRNSQPGCSKPAELLPPGMGSATFPFGGSRGSQSHRSTLGGTWKCLRGGNPFQTPTLRFAVSGWSHPFPGQEEQDNGVDPASG